MLTAPPPFTAPLPNQAPVETHLPPGSQPPPALPPVVPRPLSDIRELSEPSFIDAVVQRAGNTNQQTQHQQQQHQQQRRTSATRSSSLRGKSSVKRSGSSGRTGYSHMARKPVPTHGHSHGQAFVHAHARAHSADAGSSSYSDSTPEKSSLYSIPHTSVPPRRSSSATHIQQRSLRDRDRSTGGHHGRKASLRSIPPQHHGPRGRGDAFTVPNHGPSHSPVKAAKQRHDAVRSDAARRMPSRTFVRTTGEMDIVAFPASRHPRVKLELQVSAPLFVGGGSIEGQVKITVDENEWIKSRRSLGLGSLSVDVVGFEDLPGGRKASFLAVGTEVVDAAHPPPSNLVEPPNPLVPEEKFWTLLPSTSALPFMVSLPLDTGPPPFQSKNASVRFVLCATALIRDAGKHYRVRTSQDVQVISTYDPEKALTSLPSPLTATDELTLRHFGRCESAILTAALHRQVWVSGSSIFVDVHLANKCHKAIKKLELSLERDILCYKHAPASTREKSVSQARIFESNEQAVIARKTVKAGLQGWNGVEPHDSETKTWELELPRGHATVRCGKYFEVRFFLNVTAPLSNSKFVSVQLPITLIHINSLDVLPNSVAQVAAAIEEKRAQSQHHRTKSKPWVRGHARQRSASSPAELVDLQRQPSCSQGRAFAAPRQQSVDRQRAVKAEIDDLKQTLDSSPRKFEPQLRGAAIKKVDSKISFRHLNLSGKEIRDHNPFTDMAFRTPPTTSSESRNDRSVPERKPSTPLDPSKRLQSFSSIRTKKSTSSVRRKNDHAEVSKGRPYNFTVVRHHHQIQPHALGLSSSNEQQPLPEPAPSKPTSRPATGLSFRERMDRSRFEIKGVRRKGSVKSVKEKGLGLWEQVKNRAKEKEGWI
ncbi:uncharacterized protein LTR77_002581 [Saxophila tyrrhenica]|uniref:Arrestin C-terminal-like domain-containing protein n=1 Tax=Saxophila tyrrhenica TaxID=1690608 RepID=A0AAV9PJL3_9PEZI|nr:hypothetical protein LTR77_002581 [Saxophila tyrrhenica]